MLYATISPFSDPLIQRCALELVVLTLACAPLGCWVLLYRQTYAAESLAHSMFPGMVLAALAGLPLVLGAALGLLVAVLLIALASRFKAVGSETSVSITVTGLFGLGAILALTPSTPARVQELLFGDLLAINSTGLLLSILVAAAIGLLLVSQWRKLTVLCLQPESARALDANPRLGYAVPLLGLVLALTVAVQTLGNLLAVAAVLLPPIAAQLLCKRLINMVAVSIAIGLFSGIGGLLLSYYLDTATGATIALVAVVSYLICRVFTTGSVKPATL